MRVGYLTDKGMKRPKNEDAVKVLRIADFSCWQTALAEISPGKLQALQQQIFLQITCTTTQQNLQREAKRFSHILKNAVNFVNESILQLSNTKPEYVGMATTLVFAYVDHKILYVGNVGDSRVYFIHKDEVHQITDDHTYVNDLVKMGAITRSEADHHYKKM